MRAATPRSSMKWVLLPAILLLLAGCAQQPSVAPDQPVDRSADMRDTAALFQEPSQVVASVTYYMENHYQPPVANSSDDADEGQQPALQPPRNITIDYHGVQPQLDGWGREQPALVFSQETTQTSTSNGETTVTHGRAQVVISAADWSVLSVSMRTADLDLAVHPLPGTVGPPTGGALLFVAVQALDGDLTREILVYDGPEGKVYLRFAPDDERPLPGACDVWRIGARFEASPQYIPPEPDDTTPAANRVPPRHLLCLEDGGTSPLWTWFGSDADGADFLQRTSPGILLPPRTGDPLPAVEYELQQWQQVDAAATFLFDAPTALPPSGGEDWAARLVPLVHSLYTDRDYAEFAAGNEPWVASAVDLPAQPLYGDAAEGSPAFLGVAGRQGAWDAFVIRVGNAAVGTAPGVSLGGPGEMPEPLSMPAMPAAADVQAQVAALLAPPSSQATALLFGVANNPFLTGSDAFWVEAAGCLGESDVVPSLTFVDGIQGHVPLIVRGPDVCAAFTVTTGLRPAAAPLLAVMGPGLPAFAFLTPVPAHLPDWSRAATPLQALAA